MYQHSIPGRLAKNTWDAFTVRERSIATIGCTACVLVFVVLGAVLRVPAMMGFEGSLLAGSSPIIAFLYVIISLGICSAIGAVVGGWLDFEGGVLCIAVGLAGASARGGAMDSVLRYATSSSIFSTLIIEISLLAGMMFGARYLQTLMFDQIWPAAVRDRRIMTPENEIVSPDISEIARAIGGQVLGMAIIEILLIHTTGKSQVLPCLGLAAFLGTLLGYQIVPLANGAWYWVAPVIVAVVGYGAAYASPTGWMIGDINGLLGALARPVPLDYASIGIAGTIFGFWTARRWSQSESD